MRKSLLLVFFALLAAIHISAQSVSVRPVEFELRYGVAFSVDHMQNCTGTGGPALGMELRYNIKNSPVDVGVNFDWNYVEFDSKSDDSDQLNETFRLGVTSDYNFRQGRNVNPFAGLGIGYASNSLNMNYSDIDNTNDGRNTFYFSPRAGVELWRHLRLTLQANLICKYYSNVGLTVGVVFGGGKKKG